MRALPRQPVQHQQNKSMAKQIANPDLPAPPSGKYPAKSHSRRVAKWLAENGGPKEGVIYLEGQALREHEVWWLQMMVHTFFMLTRIDRMMTLRCTSGRLGSLSHETGRFSMMVRKCARC